jgi:hypothetical protein
MRRSFVCDARELRVLRVFRALHQMHCRFRTKPSTSARVTLVRRERRLRQRELRAATGTGEWRASIHLYRVIGSSLREQAGRLIRVSCGALA